MPIYSAPGLIRSGCPIYCLCRLGFLTLPLGVDRLRDAGNRWVFTDSTEAPWTGVRLVAFAGSPQPTHYVDLGAFLERGIASLREHAAYIVAERLRHELKTSFAAESVPLTVSIGVVNWPLHRATARGLLTAGEQERFVTGRPEIAPLNGTSQCAASGGVDRAQLTELSEALDGHRHNQQGSLELVELNIADGEGRDRVHEIEAKPSLRR